ncbi:MAG: leucyl aminopeptidase [Phascolarctobacterium sp.]|nr:leucyl aminopeptidase [Phascolarctobacterium sp.]
MATKLIVNALGKENLQAAYKKADTLVFLLCKECLDYVGNLALPENITKALKLYTDKYKDIFDCEDEHIFTAFDEYRLVNVIIVGCGQGKDCKPVNFRKAAGVSARALDKVQAQNAVLLAPALLNASRAHYLAATCEGLLLGAYTFEKYKSEAKAPRVCDLNILTNVDEQDKVLAEAKIIAESVILTRDLCNTPGNELNPVGMEQAARKVAAETGMKIEVLGPKQMEVLNMNSLLAVAQGSKAEPRLIVLKYQGAADAPFNAYVGKGITFDSGGISIKPSDGMEEMKDDMTGAGDVLGAMRAIALLKKPCNLYGIMSCAENMPGDNAQRPGDIVKAASGKTIEVLNTDAEGRMVLADAVWYAGQLGAQKIVDIATLTGAVIIALGTQTSGIVANDDDLAAAIIKAGKFSGENYWQLPSLPECKKALKSDVADIKNSCGRAGGVITGGLFIGSFVKEGLPWAHIDIGGTSTAASTDGFLIKGCTGFGTMTLIKLAGEF